MLEYIGAGKKLVALLAQQPAVVIPPLMLAVENCRSDMVALLLHYGADPDIIGSTHYDRPLERAILKGDARIVNLLIDHKTDVSLTNLAG